MSEGERKFSAIAVCGGRDKNITGVFPPCEMCIRDSPEGGLFVWCTLPDGCDMNAFVARALENKVAVVPGSAFLCDPDGASRSFRINYSTPSDENIREGCRRLGETARALGIN